MFGWLGDDHHEKPQSRDHGPMGWLDDNHHDQPKAEAAGFFGKYGQSPTQHEKTPGEVAKILKDNLGRLDTAAGGGLADKIFSHLGLGTDGVFGVQDLQKVAQDSGAPKDVRDAAQQVLDDPNLYHSIDAAGGGGVDNRISAQDLDKVQQNQAKSGNSSSILDIYRAFARWQGRQCDPGGTEPGRGWGPLYHQQP